MTNPTRTRAEMLAMLAESEHDRATDERIYKDRIEGLLNELDLIPREEHEAALLEANTRTDKVVAHLNARDAVAYLVKEYAMDWGDTPEVNARTYTEGEYRVTVERVTEKREPADAEPVGWMVGGMFTGSHEQAQNIARLNGKTVDAVYRHPAPPAEAQGTAVAPVGVVDELNELAGILEHYDKHQWAIPIRRALTRITELPTPSEWAQITLVNHLPHKPNRRECLDLMAALAALLESEARDDHA